MYLKDGKPYRLCDLRRDHPNTSFPVPLSDELLEQYNLTRLVDNPPTYNPEYEVLINEGVSGNKVQYRVEMRPDVSAYRLPFVRALEKLGYLERVYEGLKTHSSYQLWWDNVTIFERDNVDMTFFDLVDIDVSEVFRELF